LRKIEGQVWTQIIKLSYITIFINYYYGCAELDDLYANANFRAEIRVQKVCCPFHLRFHLQSVVHFSVDEAITSRRRRKSSLPRNFLVRVCDAQGRLPACALGQSSPARAAALFALGAAQLAPKIARSARWQWQASILAQIHE